MKKHNESSVVIFDCQLLQTKAWHRGMGKYTAQMLAAFLGNKQYTKGYNKIILLFNNRLAYADDLRAFVESKKTAEVVFLDLDVPKEGDQHSITLGQIANQKTLDEYVNQTFPDAKVGFMISSLFLDEACPVFPSATYNSVIYYDLIPLMYYRLYLGLGASEQYFTRFSVLLDADRVFAISETVANDLVAFLGVPKEKIINIRGASNSVEKGKSKKPRLAIEKPYILMPTGGDPRKNNLNGVKGFSRFNEQSGNRYQLLITSFFADSQKEELKKYSSDIVFTGNVTDSEVQWLYENAEAVLFPAEYEGLGLPILEAIDADRTIVCSDIAVFREISNEAFFMFDPMDPESISASLESALGVDKNELAAKKRHYKKISDYYTWDSTASIVNDCLVGGIPRKRTQKPRIAFVTPNLCQPTVEGRYIAQQFPYFRDHYDIDFYYDMSNSDLPIRPSYLAFASDVRALRDLTADQYAQYDLVVYVILNSEASVATLQAALALPGLVITTSETLIDTYGAAYAEGLMSKERVAMESGDFTGSLRAVSRGFATTVPGVDNTLGVVAPELAYPPARGRSLHNRIFVNLDISRADAQWNSDLVRDIASSVDRSRAVFTVVARTRFADEIYEDLDLPSVTLYEATSDHEYLTLLAASDLYIDARPGSSLDKLAPAFEAYRTGLDVFIGPVDGERGKVADGLFVEKDGESIRDHIYRWLVHNEDPTSRLIKMPIESDPSNLVTLIEATLQKEDSTHDK